MKKTILLTFLLLAGMTAFTSCDELDGDKDVDMRTKTFNISQNSWKWNEPAKRYEVIVEYGDIDNYMYEHGSVNAAVFITEEDSQGGTYEVMHPLPYVYSYLADFGNGMLEEVTETISFNVAPGSHRYPGTIAFYIQTSSQNFSEQWLSNYTFKVTTFWRE
jgi:hypothetical protein